MATSFGQSVPKRPRKNVKRFLEESGMAAKILSGQALPPVEIPGFFSFVSEEKVRDAILASASHSLHPIHLAATQGPDLSHALSKAADKEDPLSFSKIGWLWLGMSTFRHDLHKLPRGYVSLITGSHVRARQYQEVFEIPFGALFGDALLTPSNELKKQLCKDIHLLAHSLQCTAVSERSSTNLEHYHIDILLRLCVLVLGPNSLVLQECEVGTSEIPHGIFDLVAGVFKEVSSFTLGLTIAGEERILQDPVGIEAKMPTNMQVGVINPQLAVQACVFDEVQKATSDLSERAPTVYLSASTQYFRPFIRVKKHDLLLSTSHHILWNQPTEDGPGVEYVGAVFLLLLLQAATCADPVYPRMVTHVLEKYISNTGISKQQLSSEWNEYYDTCGVIYGNIVPHRHSRATKRKQLSKIKQPKKLNFEEFMKMH